MSVDEKQFGAALGAALEAAKLSQNQLARRMGVEATYVSAIMNGRRGVSAETVERVAQALGADETLSSRLHLAAAVDQGFKIKLPDDW